MGSAEKQGQLWGAQARDFAIYLEQVVLPLYGAVLDAARVTPGTRLLDAGCGAGLLALLASFRGADVSAIDASPELAAIARERLPKADIREGDLEALPFADARFEAVTAVNSIFYAEDIDVTMREFGRVACRGGRVVVTAWGPPERCEFLTAVMPKIGPLMPPPPPGVSPHPGALSEPCASWRKARSPVPLSFPVLKSPGAPMPAPGRTRRPSRIAAKRRFDPSMRKPTRLMRGRTGASVTKMSSSGWPPNAHRNFCIALKWLRTPDHSLEFFLAVDPICFDPSIPPTDATPTVWLRPLFLTLPGDAVIAARSRKKVQFGAQMIRVGQRRFDHRMEMPPDRHRLGQNRPAGRRQPQQSCAPVRRIGRRLDEATTLQRLEIGSQGRPVHRQQRRHAAEVR
jgi:SAM-dependent methyltransferase